MPKDCPWWPRPLTLGLQTCPSEGPNESSVRIWHKSVQWFRRYFICKQKQTKKRTFCSPLRVVINNKQLSPNTITSVINVPKYAGDLTSPTAMPQKIGQLNKNQNYWQQWYSIFCSFKFPYPGTMHDILLWKCVWDKWPPCHQYVRSQNPLYQ